MEEGKQEQIEALEKKETWGLLPMENHEPDQLQTGLSTKEEVGCNTLETQRSTCYSWIHSSNGWTTKKFSPLAQKW